MTKDEIIEIIARKLAKKGQSEGTWDNLVAGVQALTPSQKASLVERLNTGKYEAAGQMLAQAMKADAYTDYTLEATNMLADDQLSLAELELIL